MVEEKYDSLPNLRKKTEKKRTKKNSSSIIFFKISLIIILLILGFLFAWIAQREIKKRGQALGEQVENYQGGIQKKIGHFLKNTGDNVENALTSQVKTIVNTVEETVIDSASKSAGAVSSFIFENTVGNLIKQIEKLPKEQKEQIKKEICQ